MNDENWTQIGVVCVDAGIVMIGDPCYTLPDDAPVRTEAIANWQSFCELLDVTGNGVVEPAGPGSGLVVPTYCGDGTYPVYGQQDTTGRMRAVKVVFEADVADEDVDDWDDEGWNGWSFDDAPYEDDDQD